MPQLISIVVGVGPGTGAACARRFARAYPVVCMARTSASYASAVEAVRAAGGKAMGVEADVSDAESLKRGFEAIRKEYGGDVGVAAAVFNASGRFVRKGFLELTEGDFMAGLDVSAKGAFLFSQCVLPLLLSAVPASPHPPTLLFTGATASVKANARMSSFATGKFALRALSMSLAKEFGPEGVHVAHAVIDGVIDIERTKEWMKDAGPDAKISADAIADAYWYLHTQPRSTMSNEIDIRPFVEKW